MRDKPKYICFGIILGFLHTLYLTFLVFSAFYSVYFQKFCSSAYITLVADIPVFDITMFLSDNMDTTAFIILMYTIGFILWCFFGVVLQILVYYAKKFFRSDMFKL